MSTAHITFGTSGAGSPKQALRGLGSRERVVYLTDVLSLGPIDPGDTRGRTEWMESELGDVGPRFADHNEAVRSELATTRDRVMVWISTRDVTEVCGLLDLLWRAPHADLHVVDVANVAFTRNGAPAPHASTSFGYVSDAQILSESLVEHAVPLSDAQRAAHRATWERLRHENAALRVIARTGVVSAPISYFDDAILGCVSHEFRTHQAVIGDVLSIISDGELRQCSWDRFYFERLARLAADDDRIESSDDDELVRRRR